jgi:hypothetical protein
VKSASSLTSCSAQEFQPSAFLYRAVLAANTLAIFQFQFSALIDAVRLKSAATDSSGFMIGSSAAIF